jgi:hypothetical protein
MYPIQAGFFCENSEVISPYIYKGNSAKIQRGVSLGVSDGVLITLYNKPTCGLTTLSTGYNILKYWLEQYDITPNIVYRLEPKAYNLFSFPKCMARTVGANKNFR